MGGVQRRNRNRRSSSSWFGEASLRCRQRHAQSMALVVQGHELVGAERELGVGLAVVVAELDITARDLGKATASKRAQGHRLVREHGGSRTRRFARGCIAPFRIRELTCRGPGGILPT